MKPLFRIAGITLALFSLVLTACNNKSSEETLLTFKMKEGNSYEYLLNMSLDQELMGQQTKMQMGTSFTMEPTGSQDSSQTIKATYDRFFLKVDAGGMSMDIDTDQDLPAGNIEDFQSNPILAMQRVFGGIKGKSVTMQVNGKGEVTEVQGYREIFSAMADELSLPEEQKAQLLISMQDQFSDKAMRDQFTTFFSAFANRMVKVGDTWSATAEMGGQMDGEMTNKYTVKNIAGNDVTLGVESVFTGKGSESLNGSQKGTIVVNTDLGIVTTGDLTQDFKVKAEGMTIDMKGKTTIKGRVK